MKKPKKMLSSKAVMAMFAAAGLLLLSGSVGGARAALTYYSDTYSSRVQLSDIGVTLLEQGEAEKAENSWKEVSKRNYNSISANWSEESEPLLEGMLGKDEDGTEETLKLGKAYHEKLKVQNTGTINEYVRVSVYKYWVDAEGEKVPAPSGDDAAENDPQDSAQDPAKATTLDPAWIELGLVNQNVWLEDAEAHTDERVVLYYSQPVKAKEFTPEFMDSLTINNELLRKAEKKTKTETTVVDGKTCTTVTSTYDFDGVSFRLEVQVDAVQEHNAADAIWSAWGRKVTMANGVITGLN